MALAEPCFRCGLENPETFPACARCHAPVSHAPLTAVATTTNFSSDEFAAFQSQEFSVDEAVAAVDRSLLGREHEVGLAREIIGRAFSTRRPSVLVIEAPRGGGSSRMLLHSAHVAVGLAANVRFAHGHCVEGRGGELAPFPRMLLDRFRIAPSSSEISARARVMTEVADALGSADAVAISTMAHLVGDVAGLDFPDSPILRAFASNPDELEQKRADAVARFYEADARERPLWIGIDNAETMDDPAWDVVRAVARSEAPIVLVVAGATGLASLAKSRLPGVDLHAVTLHGLDERDVAELVRRIIPTLRHLPDALVAAIAHRSGGLPAEARQLVFSLYESGFFAPSEDGSIDVDMSKLESGELPISMDDALVARLVRLDPDERRVLEHAAICGESFWDGALLCEHRFESEDPDLSIGEDDPETDARDLARILGQLVAKGFVAVDSSGGRIVPANGYRFVVGRMRSIVYASIPEPSRRTRHLAVARWLSVATESHRDAVAATVGFHLELGGDSAGAGVAYARAGAYERAHRRFDRALRWLERADHCTPTNDPMARLDLAHERGAVLVSSGRFDEAIDAFTRMHALARRLGARAKQAAALDRIARAQLARGLPKKSLVLLERALVLVRKAEDRRGIASCLDDLAQVELVLGNIDRAHMAAIEALEIRRALADARGESVSLTTLGRIALRRGELMNAEERLRAALVIRESLGDLEGTIVTTTALGRVAFERGDREIAIEMWQRVLEHAREIADRRSEQALLSHIGEACVVLGRYAAADNALSRSRELAIELDDRRALARVDVLVGRAAMRRGDEKAARLLKLALESAEHAGANDVLGLAHRALGQLYAMRVTRDDTAASAAERHLRKSADAFRSASSDKERARTLLDLAHLLDRRGDPAGAKAQAEIAMSLLRATQLPELVAARGMART